MPRTETARPLSDSELLQREEEEKLRLKRQKDEEARQARREAINTAIREAMSEKERKRDAEITRQNAIDDAKARKESAANRTPSFFRKDDVGRTIQADPRERIKDPVTGELENVNAWRARLEAQYSNEDANALEIAAALPGGIVDTAAGLIDQTTEALGIPTNARGIAEEGTDRIAPYMKTGEYALSAMDAQWADSKGGPLPSEVGALYSKLERTDPKAALAMKADPVTQAPLMEYLRFKKDHAAMTAMTVGQELTTEVVQDLAGARVYKSLKGVTSLAAPIAAAFTETPEAVLAAADTYDDVYKRLSDKSDAQEMMGEDPISELEKTMRAGGAAAVAGSADMIGAAVFSGLEKRLYGADAGTGSVTKDLIKSIVGEGIEEGSVSAVTTGTTNLAAKDPIGKDMARGVVDSTITGSSVGGGLSVGKEAADRGIIAVDSYNAIRGQTTDTSTIDFLSKAAEQGANQADAVLSRSSDVGNERSAASLRESLTDTVLNASTPKETKSEAYNQMRNTMAQAAADVLRTTIDDPEVQDIVNASVNLFAKDAGLDDTVDFNDPSYQDGIERDTIVAEYLKNADLSTYAQDSEFTKTARANKRKADEIEVTGVKVLDDLNKNAAYAGMPKEFINKPVSNESATSSSKLLNSIVAAYNDANGTNYTVDTLTAQQASTIDKGAVGPASRALYVIQKNAILNQATPTAPSTTNKTMVVDAEQDRKGAIEIATVDKKISRRKAAGIALSLAASDKPVSRAVTKAIRSGKIRIADFDAAGETARERFGSNAAGSTKGYYVNGTIYLDTKTAKNDNERTSIIDHELDHMFRYDDGLANVDVLYSPREDGGDGSSVDKFTRAVAASAQKAVLAVQNKKTKDIKPTDLAALKAYNHVLNTAEARKLAKELNRDITVEDMLNPEYEKELGGELTAYYLQFKRELFKRGLSKEYLSDLNSKDMDFVSTIGDSTFKTITGKKNLKEVKKIADGILTSRLNKLTDEQLLAVPTSSTISRSTVIDNIAADAEDEPEAQYERAAKDSIEAVNSSSLMLFALYDNIPNLTKDMADRMSTLDIKQRVYLVKAVLNHVNARIAGEESPKLATILRPTFGKYFSEELQKVIDDLSLDLMTHPRLKKDSKEVTEKMLGEAALAAYRGMTINGMARKTPLLISTEPSNGDPITPAFLQGLLEYLKTVPIKSIANTDSFGTSMLPDFEEQYPNVELEKVEGHSTSREVNKVADRAAVAKFINDSIDKTNVAVINTLVDNMDTSYMETILLEAVYNATGSKATMLKALMRYSEQDENHISKLNQQQKKNALLYAIKANLLEPVDTATTLEVLNPLAILFGLAGVITAIRNEPRAIDSKKSSGTMRGRIDFSGHAPVTAVTYIDKGKLKSIDVPGLADGVTLYASSPSSMYKNDRGKYVEKVQTSIELLFTPDANVVADSSGVLEKDGALTPAANTTPFVYQPMNSLIPQLSISNGFTKFAQVPLSNKALYSEYEAVAVREWAIKTAVAAAVDIHKITNSTIREWVTTQLQLTNGKTWSLTAPAERARLLTDKLNVLLAGSPLEAHVDTIISMASGKDVDAKFWGILGAALAEAEYTKSVKEEWPIWVKALGMHSRNNPNKLGASSRSFYNNYRVLEALKARSPAKALANINVMGWTAAVTTVDNDKVIGQNLLNVITQAVETGELDVSLQRLGLDEPYVNQETLREEPLFLQELPTSVDPVNYLKINDMYVHITALTAIYKAVSNEEDEGASLMAPVEDIDITADYTADDEYEYTSDPASIESSDIEIEDEEKSAFSELLQSMFLVSNAPGSNVTVSPASPSGMVRTWFPYIGDKKDMEEYARSLTSFVTYELTEDDKLRAEAAIKARKETAENNALIEEVLLSSTDPRKRHKELKDLLQEDPMYISRKVYREAATKELYLGAEMLGSRDPEDTMFPQLTPTVDDILYTIQDRLPLADVTTGLNLDTTDEPLLRAMAKVENALYQAYFTNAKGDELDIASQTKEKGYSAAIDANALADSLEANVFNSPITAENYKKKVSAARADYYRKTKGTKYDQVDPADLKSKIEDRITVVNNLNNNKPKKRLVAHTPYTANIPATSTLPEVTITEVRAHVKSLFQWYFGEGVDVSGIKYSVTKDGKRYVVKVSSMTPDIATMVLKRGVFGWPSVPGFAPHVIDFTSMYSSKFYSGLIPSIDSFKGMTPKQYYTYLKTTYPAEMLMATMLPYGHQYASMYLMMKYNKAVNENGIVGTLYNKEPELLLKALAAPLETDNHITTTVPIDYKESKISNTDEAKLLRIMDGMRDASGMLAASTVDDITDDFFYAFSTKPLKYKPSKGDKYTVEEVESNSKELRLAMLEVAEELPPAFDTPPGLSLSELRDYAADFVPNWGSNYGQYVMRADANGQWGIVAKASIINSAITKENIGIFDRSKDNAYAIPNPFPFDTPEFAAFRHAHDTWMSRLSKEHEIMMSVLRETGDSSLYAHDVANRPVNEVLDLLPAGLNIAVRRMIESVYTVAEYPSGGQHIVAKSPKSFNLQPKISRSTASSKNRISIMSHLGIAGTNIVHGNQLGAEAYSSSVNAGIFYETQAFSFQVAAKQLRESIDELRRTNPDEVKAVLQAMQSVDKAVSKANIPSVMAQSLMARAITRAIPQQSLIPVVNDMTKTYFRMRTAVFAMENYINSVMQTASTTIGNKPDAIKLMRERLRSTLKKGIGGDLLLEGVSSALPDSIGEVYQETIDTFNSIVSGKTSPNAAATAAMDEGLASLKTLIDKVVATTDTSAVVRGQLTAYHAAADKTEYLKSLLKQYYESYNNSGDTQSKRDNLVMYAVMLSKDDVLSDDTVKASTLLGSRISSAQYGSAVLHQLTKILSDAILYASASNSSNPAKATTVSRELSDNNALYQGARLDSKTASIVLSVNAVKAQQHKTWKLVLDAAHSAVSAIETARIIKLALNPLVWISSFIGGASTSIAIGAGPTDIIAGFSGLFDYLMVKDSANARAFIQSSGLSASQLGQAEIINTLRELLVEDATLRAEYKEYKANETLKGAINILVSMGRTVINSQANRPSKAGYWFKLSTLLLLGGIESAFRYATYRAVLRVEKKRTPDANVSRRASTITTSIYPTLNKKYTANDSTINLLFLYINFFTTQAIAFVKAMHYLARNIITHPSIAVKVRHAAGVGLMLFTYGDVLPDIYGQEMYGPDLYANAVKAAYSKYTGVSQEASRAASDLVSNTTSDGTPVIVSTGGAVNPAGPLIQGPMKMLSATISAWQGNITEEQYSVEMARAITNTIDGMTIASPIASAFPKAFRVGQKDTLAGIAAFATEAWNAVDPRRTGSRDEANKIFDGSVPLETQIFATLFNMRPYKLTLETSLMYSGAGIHEAAFSTGYPDIIKNYTSVGYFAALLPTESSIPFTADTIEKQARYFGYVQATAMISALNSAKSDTPFGEFNRNQLAAYAGTLKNRKYIETITAFTAQHGANTDAKLQELFFGYKLAMVNDPQLAVGTWTTDVITEYMPERSQALNDALYALSASPLEALMLNKGLVPESMNPYVLPDTNIFTFDSVEAFLKLKTATKEAPVLFMENGYGRGVYFHDADTLNILEGGTGIVTTSKPYRIKGYDAPEKSVSGHDASFHKLLDTAVQGMVGPITMRVPYEAYIGPMGKVGVNNLSKNEKDYYGVSKEEAEAVALGSPLYKFNDKPVVEGNDRILGNVMISGALADGTVKTVFLHNVAKDIGLSGSAAEVPVATRAAKKAADLSKSQEAISYAEKWVPEGLDSKTPISDYDALELATELLKDYPIGASVESKGSSAPVFRRGNRIIINKDKFTTRRALVQNILNVKKGDSP